ncbi:MAG: hypothetical protein GX853_04560, partial [Chloroflexi bacterium]|nr:hypothetical protein [Chloroflexota bacterium]
GYLKYEIAEEVDLRIMPKLRFFWDPTPQRADRIDALIAQIQAENKEKEAEMAEDEDEEASDGEDLIE